MVFKWLLNDVTSLLLQQYLLTVISHFLQFSPAKS